MYQKSSDLQKYLIISIYIDFLRFYFPFFCIHWLMGHIKGKPFISLRTLVTAYGTCWLWMKSIRYWLMSLRIKLSSTLNLLP